MARKDYSGRCGSCKYCELRDGYTFAYSTSFMCSRNNYRVKADEKPCNRYEADGSRTNDMIERYDK